MDNKFELIARKQRTPYTENPSKYHPTPSNISFKPLIAIGVCATIAAVFAYFTQDQVAIAFTPILRMKTLSTFYFSALIAYYTVALYIIYVFILLAERYGIEAYGNDEIPSYGAVAVSCTTRVMFGVVFLTTLPFFLSDELTLSRLHQSYVYMIYLFVCAWFYLFIPMSIYIAYQTNKRKKAA